MRRIVGFGLGQYYTRYSNQIKQSDRLVALLDNNPAFAGNIRNGVKVYAPNAIVNLKYDKVLLFAGEHTAIAMRRQLLNLGVPKRDILFADEYFAHHNYKVYLPKSEKGEIVFFGSPLSLGGATMALLNAIQCIQECGYGTTLVVPTADESLLDFVRAAGIKTVVYPGMRHPKEREIHWMRQFNLAVVNVFQNIECACSLARVLPVVWWIHEPSNLHCSIYADISVRYEQYMVSRYMKKINVFAVSGIAKKNFSLYFPKVDVGILPFCVSDFCEKFFVAQPCRTQAIVFAVVASVCCEVKGQLLFLKAAKKLNRIYHKKVEYMLVGDCKNDEYGMKVKEKMIDIQNVRITGLMSRTQLRDSLKKDVDVVVCSSFEETLSAAVIEGLMLGKICITSDNTGIAEYIRDGVNGFVFKAGDADSLFEKMRYIVEHFESFGKVQKSARKTYEENFTPRIFSHRFENIVSTVLGTPNDSRNEGNESSLILSRRGGVVKFCNINNYSTFIHHTLPAKEVA